MKSQKKKKKDGETARHGDGEINLPTFGSPLSAEPVSTEPQPAPDDGEIKDLHWLIGCIAVVAVSVFWRFWQLELKPLHHDEGVNSHFLMTLFRDGIYRYDPANYHGPDLYYLALAFSKMFGLNTISIRASVAIFGVLIVVLALFLKNYIGKIGSLAAALFLALSPGMVYISRYFIHEILFVFFSFGIVVGVLYFIEKRKAGAFALAAMTLLLLICFLPTVLNLATVIGKDNATVVWVARLGLFAVEASLVYLVMRTLLAWRDGSPIYLLLASASAILLFATKETAFITIGTMLIACVCVWLWRKVVFNEFSRGTLLWSLGSLSAVFIAILLFIKLFSNLEISLTRSVLFLTLPFIIFLVIEGIGRLRRTQTPSHFVEPTWAAFRERLGDSSDIILIIAACSFVFIYVGVLFFSSFFTYPEGVQKAFEAYAIWTKTGNKDHTQNGTLAYVKWLWKIESPILILSALGSLIALAKARHRFALFTAFWAIGITLAYTIIPYKTPWLAVSFILPMCVIAGYGINELVRSKDTGVKILGAILTAVAVAILGYQTYDLNFERYDDDTMPYVYAHTRRGFLDLIKEIERYADKSGKGKDATIEIVSPEYWSMPWYTRDYPKANYHGRFADASTSEMVVASEAQLGELSQRYGAHYKVAGKYPLRPGVELYLLVRKDLAEPNALEIYQVTGGKP